VRSEKGGPVVGQIWLAARQQDIVYISRAVALSFPIQLDAVSGPHHRQPRRIPPALARFPFIYHQSICHSCHGCNENHNHPWHWGSTHNRTKGHHRIHGIPQGLGPARQQGRSVSLLRIFAFIGIVLMRMNARFDSTDNRGHLETEIGVGKLIRGLCILAALSMWLHAE